MCNEHHFIEYKDFHKEKQPNKKIILAKIFKEICAFANADGGTIVVGKEDKTGIESKQPDCIYEWLENEALQTSINNLSDNLIVLSSDRNGNLIHIKVHESVEAISAKSDTSGVNQGDCFIRENHETIIAKGEKLKKLMEKKSLSEDGVLRALAKIVHYKIKNNMNHANQMNVFDSLFISVESPHDYINVFFEVLVKHEFIMGIKMPLSKYSTLQMHAEIFDKKSSPFSHTVMGNNKELFEELMKSEHTRESFFRAHVNEVLCSPQLKAYILEHKQIVEGL